jgi:alkylated DNA repair dioxygenase AlkB
MQMTLFSRPKETLPAPDLRPVFIEQLPQIQADNLLEFCRRLKWQQNAINMRGKTIQLPRMEYIAGDLGAYYKYGNVQLNAEPWPNELECLARRMENVAGLRSGYFGMVIGNHYSSGRQHIGWHADDAKTIGPDPAIVSISLGQSRKFQARIGRDGPIQSYQMDHGSVLFMPAGMQAHWKHRLPQDLKAFGLRINLTFRPFHRAGGS